jgi:hypothetical protein
MDPWGCLHKRHYASRRLLTHPSRRAASWLVFNVRQNMKLALLVLAFSALAFGGCAREQPTLTKSPSTVAVDPRIAAIQANFQTELAIMTRYRANPNGFDVMEREQLLARARWFFSKIDLIGLHRTDVEAMLGNSPRQMYGNGEIFVIREIIYDSSNKVESVKASPSE